MTDSNDTSSYPIQTSDFTETSAPPPESACDYNRILPSSIRALKDSKDASSHERTLIICLDGTGDQFDGDNSNVVHFVSCLKKHSPDQQVTYYQSGIGTYDKGGISNGIGAAMDMAVGSGLGIHIKDAYQFLMQNYQDGDKICLLGFSRGAYTVRCLAGMLHKVGLLPASNGAQINFAYNFYKDDSEEGWKMSAEFKKTFCTDVTVYFLGLWDCVASVGFIPRKLPFSKSATRSTRYVRHAMALDEHRAKFKVCQWQHNNPDLTRKATVDVTPKAQVKRGLKKTGILGRAKKASAEKAERVVEQQPQAATEGMENSAHSSTTAHSARWTPRRLIDDDGKSTDDEEEQEKLEADFEALDARRRQIGSYETDALEVWFLGCHADCGGGAVANEERHKLARIPFRWMVRQCFDCNTGILFDTACLADQGLDVYTLWPTYQPPTVPQMTPSPHLQEKFETSKLPALHHRSALLRIGKHDDDEEEELAELRERYSGAVLPESTEDHFDSLSRINDQLTDAKGWWVLEFWPVKVRLINREGDGWEKKVRMNMGRYRAIRETQPCMHWTVQRRIDEGKYKLKGRLTSHASWKVVA